MANAVDIYLNKYAIYYEDLKEGEEVIIVQGYDGGIDKYNNMRAKVCSSSMQGKLFERCEIQNACTTCHCKMYYFNIKIPGIKENLCSCYYEVTNGNGQKLLSKEDTYERAKNNRTNNR